MKKNVAIWVFLVSFYILSIDAFAVQNTWSATLAGNWNVPGNWSGGHVPIGTEDVVFDDTSIVDCTIDVNVSVKSISINAGFPGYTGVITQNAGKTVTTTVSNPSISFTISSGTYTNSNPAGASATFTSQHFTISGGTFNGGQAHMQVTGCFSQSGGTFNSSSDLTNGLRILGLNSAAPPGTPAFNYTGGIFSTTSSGTSTGVVRMQMGATGGGVNSFIYADATVAPGVSFHNLRFEAKNSATMQLLSNLTVLNDFTIIQSTAGTTKVSLLNAGVTYAISVHGDFFFGDPSSTTGIIQLTSNGGNINLLDDQIEPDGAGAPIPDTNTPGSDLFIYNTGATPTVLVVPINFIGSGNSTITSSVAAGQGILPFISIAKPNGNFSMSGNITLSGDWTYTGGAIVDPQTSTVEFIKTGAGTQNITAPPPPSSGAPGMLFNDIFIANTGTSSKVLLKSELTLKGNMTITENNAGTATFSTNTSPSYNINVGGNWTESVSPVQGNFVPNLGTVTFTGTSGTQTITSHTNFYKVVLNTSGSNVTLANAVTVTNKIDFTSGIMNTTSSNILIIPSGATAAGGTGATTVGPPATVPSYVDGPMQKIGNAAFTFPIGSGIVGVFRPLTMTAPVASGGLTTDAFTAQYFKVSPVATFGSAINDTSVPPIVKLNNFEYWDFIRTNGASTVNVTICWKTSDTPDPNYVTDLGLAVPDLRVAELDIGTSTWAGDGGTGVTGTGAQGTIRSTSLSVSPSNTSIHHLTLGSTDDSNSLPIELSSFNAVVVDNTVQLKWKTEVEVNNDFFTVMRSGNGISFEDIAYIKSKTGTGSKAENYEWVDGSPLTGLSYYRLKQTDFDKRESIFQTVNVNVLSADNFSVSPNPSDGSEINLNFPRLDTENMGLAKVVVSDLSGRPIFSDDLKTESSTNLKFDLNRNISPGLYIIRVTVQQQSYVSKLLVK